MTADAVVVLGGRPNRVSVGVALVRAGAAPVLLVFNADGSSLDLPGGGEAGEAITIRPDPYSTRGEAAIVASLARERGWSSLVVVT